MSIVVGTPGNAYGPTEAISDIITFAQDPRVRQVAGSIGRGLKRGFQRGREYFRSRKKRSASTMRKSGKGVAGAGVWHGRFPGSLQRPSSLRYTSGYSEKAIYSDNTSQPMVNYLGVSSLPLGQLAGAVGSTFKLKLWDGVTDTADLPMAPTRILDDICIAALRKFFKYYHPGRIDIESDQWTWGDYMNKYGISTDTVFSTTAREMLCMLFDYPDSVSTSYQRSELQLSSSMTLRDIGMWMAGQIWYRFYDQGMIPYELGCLVGFPGDTGNIKNPMTTKATMRLNGMNCSCSVKTIIKMQNVTTSEKLEAENPSTAITSIAANPLRGRMYYLKGLSPVVRTGFLEAKTGANAYDEWLMANYKWPNAGLAYAVPNAWFSATGANHMYNVITTNDAPTGVWRTVPPDSYFRNCTGSKVIELEPGVQKFEVLKYNYSGSLVGFLRKLLVWFGVTGGPDARNNAYYQFKLGSCLLFAFEKRIRADGSDTDSTNIGLAYQVDTSVNCGVSVCSAVLARHVSTYPAN